MSNNNTPTPSILASETKMAKDLTTLEGLAEISFPAQKSDIKRPTLNLAIALDASGSMSCQMAGASALDHAKAATLSLLDRLNDNDRVAIIAYSNTPVIVMESVPVSVARGLARKALAALRPGGSTALHAGWLAAAQQAAPFVSEYSLSRVLLLSDGQATDGITDEKMLAAEAEKLCAAGLTTSTYGLGLNFNERLMTGMAVGGVARYAETADTLVPYFESDFSMLAQTVARSVHLDLSAKDAETGEVIDANLLGGGSNDNGKWRLTAGVAGASSWAAFSVNVDQRKKIEVRAKWEVVGLDGKTTTLENDVVFARGKGKKNDSVVARIAEVKAAAAAEAAADAARRGDRVGTREHLNTLRGLAGASAYACAVSNHLSVLENSGDLGALAKETAYVGSTMRTRVVDANERHDVLSEDRFGLRKAVQGKTSSTTDKKSS